MSGPNQIVSISRRLHALERRVQELERAAQASKPVEREDDPTTPLFDESTGDYRTGGER